MISTSWLMLRNRAFDTTWRRTSAVSSAVSRDPTICLVVPSLVAVRKSDCRQEGLPSPQFCCEGFDRTLACCRLRLCRHRSWLSVTGVDARLMYDVCGKAEMPYSITISWHVIANIRSKRGNCMTYFTMHAHKNRYPNII